MPPLSFNARWVFKFRKIALIHVIPWRKRPCSFVKGTDFPFHCCEGVWTTLDPGDFHQPKKPHLRTRSVPWGPDSNQSMYMYGMEKSIAEGITEMTIQLSASGEEEFPEILGDVGGECASFVWTSSDPKKDPDTFQLIWILRMTSWLWKSRKTTARRRMKCQLPGGHRCGSRILVRGDPAGFAQK